MKSTPLPPRQKRAKGRPQPLPREHVEGHAQSKVGQKAGGYKRVEVYLGAEAAIALRALMRDGRSAREVIEALLIAERQRVKGGH